MHHRDLRLIIAVYRPKRLTTVQVWQVAPWPDMFTRVRDIDVLHAHYKDFKDALQFPGFLFSICQGLHRVINKATYQCLKYNYPIYVILRPYVVKGLPHGG